MPRVKRGTKRRDYRHKTLARASGYFLTKSKLNRAAQEAVEKALSMDSSEGAVRSATSGRYGSFASGRLAARRTSPIASSSMA